MQEKAEMRFKVIFAFKFPNLFPLSKLLQTTSPLIFTLHQKILPLKKVHNAKLLLYFFVKMTEILLLEMTAGWMLIRVFLRLQLKISGSKESCLHMGTYINDVRF